MGPDDLEGALPPEGGDVLKAIQDEIAAGMREFDRVYLSTEDLMLTRVGIEAYLDSILNPKPPPEPPQRLP